MDYKYINQLLERYWRGESSLEEEDILRAFFNQEDIPAELSQYKPVFAYGDSQKVNDVLGDAFDERVMAMIDAEQPVKARIITMPQRFKPLFKAAAMVAIILTLGNAMQLPFGKGGSTDNVSQYDGYDMPEVNKENSVALRDSAVIDTMKQSMAQPTMSSIEESMVK